MADDFISAAAAAAPPVPEGGGGIQSLKDFVDVKNIAPPSALAGLKGDLTTMGDKFKDMGASFKNSDQMKNLVNNMEAPKSTNFTGQFGSLKDLMGGFKSDIAGMTGAGSGTLGLPNVQDFMHSVTGSPELSAIGGGPITAVSVLSGEASADNNATYSDVQGISDGHGSTASFDVVVTDGVYMSATVRDAGTGYAVGDSITISGESLGGIAPDNDLIMTVDTIGPPSITLDMINAALAKVDAADSLFESAGIDIEIPATPPKVGLGQLMTAATSLHKIGADSIGGSLTGAGDMLKKMLTSNTPGATAEQKMFGDSIKVAMAEGKNKALMMANGVKPPSFNPFEGAPSYTGADSSLNTNAAANLLSGGAS